MLSHTIRLLLLTAMVAPAQAQNQDPPEDPGGLEMIESAPHEEGGEPKKLKIRVDSSGMIFIEGNPADVKAFDVIYRELIKDYAEANTTRPDIRVYELKHVDVSFAASLLDEIFNDQRRAPQAAQRNVPPRGQDPAAGRARPGREGRQEPEPEEEHDPRDPLSGILGEGDDITQAINQLQGEQAIRVVANKQHNTLIIRARTDDFPDIIALLNKIDRKADVAAREYNIVQLQNIIADDAKAMVEELLGIGQQPAARTAARAPRAQQPAGRGAARGAGGAASEAARRAEEMLEEEVQLGPEGQRFSKSDISIASLPSKNSIVVFGPTGPREQIVTIVKELDKEGEEGGEKVKGYELTKADAVSLARTLQEAYELGASGAVEGNARSGRTSKIISITADESTNTIYVVAPPHLREEIQKQIEAAERLAGQLGSPRVVRITNGDAQSIAEKLNEIYEAKGRKGAKKVHITGDRATNQLFVTAPEEDFKQIQSLVAGMDQPDTDQPLSQDYALKFAYAPDVKQRIDETVLMLARTMKESGQPVDMGGFAVIADARTNKLIVMGSPKAQMLVAQALTAIDVEPPAVAERKTETIQLVHADAEEVARSLTKLYTSSTQRGTQGMDPPKAESNKSTNAVIVEGTQRQIDEIRKLVATLDAVPQAQARVTQVFQLEHADPQQVVGAIESLNGGRGAEVQEKDRISAVAELQTRSVVVTASVAQLDKVSEVIDKLDVSTSLRKFHVFKLEGGDATEVARILQQSLESQAGRGGPSRPTITADPAQNAVIAYASESEVKGIESLIKELDSGEGPSSGAPQRIALEHQNASQLADLLTQVFTEPARQDRGRGPGQQAREVPLILADDATGDLIVRAQQKDFEDIKKMVEELDVPEAAAGGGGIRLITVAQGVNVEEMARTIEDTIERGEQANRQGNSNYRPKVVSIGTDVRTNTLLVSGSPALFDEVEQIVRKLEGMKPTGPSAVRVINLGALKAEEVKQVLDQMMQDQQGQPAGGGRRPPRRR